MGREFRFRLPEGDILDYHGKIEETYGISYSITRWLPSGAFWWSTNTPFLHILIRDMICIANGLWIETYYHKMEKSGKHWSGYLDEDSYEPMIVRHAKAKVQKLDELRFQPRPFEDEIHIEWRDGSEIKTTQVQRGFILTGNQPGLLSVATHLVSLVQEDVPEGTSIYYDKNTLKKGSVPLIFQKQEKPSPPDEIVEVETLG